MTQLMVTTLSNAAVYALIAVSLNVVYRSSGILNFGAGYMAAFVGVAYATSLPADPRGVMLAVTLGAGLGLAAYVTAVWWGQRSGFDHVALSLGLLGFGMILDFVAGQVWSPEGFSAAALVQGSITVGGTTFATKRVVVVLLAALFIGALLFLIERTMVGNAFEATSSDAELAGLYGVRTGVIACVAWALAGAALGLAGVLQTTISAVSMTSALLLVIFGIAAAVVGGLGSIQNAVIGALAVALVQAAFIQFVSPRYSVSMVFVLLFVVLALRPGGLLANARVAERV